MATDDATEAAGDARIQEVLDAFAAEYWRDIHDRVPDSVRVNAYAILSRLVQAVREECAQIAHNVELREGSYAETGDSVDFAEHVAAEAAAHEIVERIRALSSKAAEIPE